MEALIFLGGAAILFVVFGIFWQWAERRDAKAAVREIVAMRDMEAKPPVR